MKLTRRQIERYLRLLAKEMALKDWSIHVSSEACESDSFGEVACTTGRKQATIWFSDRFLSDMDDIEQRYVCVHELVHCHINPPWDQLPKYVSADVLNVINIQFEYAVDGLASALAPFLPLPSDRIK